MAAEAGYPTAVPEKKRGGAFEFRFPGGWRRSLLAILLGNLIYFATMPYMPEVLRHQPDSFDWGLLVDFVICVAVFRLTYLVWRE